MLDHALGTAREDLDPRPAMTARRHGALDDYVEWAHDHLHTGEAVSVVQRGQVGRLVAVEHDGKGLCVRVGRGCTTRLAVERDAADRRAGDAHRRAAAVEQHGTHTADTHGVVQRATRIDDDDVIGQARAVGHDGAPIGIDPEVVQRGRSSPRRVPQHRAVVAHANAALDAGHLGARTQSDIAHDRRKCEHRADRLLHRRRYGHGRRSGGRRGHHGRVLRAGPAHALGRSRPYRCRHRRRRRRCRR